MIEMGAKHMMSNSLRIAWKDLMELFRNRMGLVLLILMPLFMMAMVGFIFPSSNSSLSNVPIALTNDDTGFGGYNLSSTFITALNGINDATGMMKLTDASSLADIREMIQTDNAEGGIIISSDFTSNIMNGQQGTITIVTDQSNPQMSSMIQNSAITV